MTTLEAGERALPRGIGISVALVGVIVIAMFTSEYVVYVMTLAAVYGMLAVGLDVLLGYTGYISLAQGAFFGIGAYASATLTTDYGWSFWVVLPIVTALVAVFALMLGLPVFRTHGLYFAVVTLGIGLVAHGLFVSLRSVTGGVGGYIGIPAPDPVPGLGIEVESPLRLLILAVVLLWIVIMAAYRFVSSRSGAYCLAIREDQVLAESVGVSVRRARMAAFVFAGAAAGAAGSYFAALSNFVAPDTFGVITTGFAVVVMVVVGGMGTVWGPLLGAAVLVAIPEVLRVASEYSLLAYGVVLLLTILFAPRGLAGLLTQWTQRIAGLGSRPKQGGDRDRSTRRATEKSGEAQQ